MTVIASVPLVLAACTGSGDDEGAEEGGGETITLSYAFYAPQSSFPGLQMEEWADELNARTDGQVEVELYPGGTLLGPGDIYDGVTQGVVDVGLDSPHNDASRFPFSSVMNLPFGISSSQVGSSVFLDLLNEFAPSEFDGYQIITAFTTEPAYVLSAQEIESADDVRGLDMRAPGPLVTIAEGIGVVPTSMPATEVAAALETSVIDGTLSSRDVLLDLGLGEYLGYMVDYPFGPAGTFVAVMDSERYAELPEDVRAEIEGLQEEMMEFASTYHDETNVAESVARTEEDFGLTTVTLDEADTAEWDAISEQIVLDWVDAHADADFDAQAVIDRARELAEAAGES